jgi:hypothetical protein
LSALKPSRKFFFKPTLRNYSDQLDLLGVSSDDDLLIRRMQGTLISHIRREGGAVAGWPFKAPMGGSRACCHAAWDYTTKPFYME